MTVSNEKMLWALFTPELTRDVPVGWLSLVSERLRGLEEELECARGDREQERGLRETLQGRATELVKQIDAVDNLLPGEGDRLEVIADLIGKAEMRAERDEARAALARPFPGRGRPPEPPERAGFPSAT